MRVRTKRKAVRPFFNLPFGIFPNAKTAPRISAAPFGLYPDLESSTRAIQAARPVWPLDRVASQPRRTITRPPAGANMRPSGAITPPATSGPLPPPVPIPKKPGWPEDPLNKLERLQPPRRHASPTGGRFSVTTSTGLTYTGTGADIRNKSPEYLRTIMLHRAIGAANEQQRQAQLERDIADWLQTAPPSDRTYEAPAFSRQPRYTTSSDLAPQRSEAFQEWYRTKFLSPFPAADKTLFTQRIDTEAMRRRIDDMSYEEQMMRYGRATPQAVERHKQELMQTALSNFGQFTEQQFGLSPARMSPPQLQAATKLYEQFLKYNAVTPEQKLNAAMEAMKLRNALTVAGIQAGSTLEAARTRAGATTEAAETQAEATREAARIRAETEKQVAETRARAQEKTAGTYSRGPIDVHSYKHVAASG